MNPFDFSDVPPLAAPAPIRPRARMWVIAAGAGLLACGLGAAYLATHGSGPPPAGDPSPPAVTTRPTPRPDRTPEPKPVRPDPPVAAIPESAEPSPRPVPPFLRLPARRLSPEDQVRWDRARKALAAPDQLVLYALDPCPPRHEHPRGLFHGWKVLGRVPVREAGAREAMDAAVGGIRPGVGAKCFEPRHGVRATAGSESVDVVICFECAWAYVYLGVDDDYCVMLTIGRDHAPALEKVLTGAGIRRPVVLSEIDW
jgi:hypothetical protein